MHKTPQKSFTRWLVDAMDIKRIYELKHIEQFERSLIWGYDYGV